MATRRFLLAFSFFALVLGLAASAEAQVSYSMSGDMFNYCCSTTGRFTVPYGNYGYITGAGKVTAIPAVPVPSIRVKQGRFKLTTANTYTNPVTTGTYVSGTTNFTGYNATGTLAPGGGPGNFGYCPGYAGNPNCTAPNQGTTNGLVSFTAGTNQFGGTLNMLGTYSGTSKYRSGGGYLLVPFNTPPSIIGGGYAKKTVLVRTPVYSIGGYTYAATPFTWQLTGFPWTTGQAMGKATAITPYGSPFTATTTGTDSRTPLGAGNITLVTATMGRGLNQSYAFVGRLRMTLASPTPSMSPVGLAAAAGLLLLVVGYAARRKL